MLNKTGIPTIELIKSRFPDTAVLIKPKAITECYEAIPCNPCSTSCPFGAITIGEDINQPPVVDFNKCTGCGICVYSCPGLAIMTVQIINDTARFKIPFEFRPLPKENQVYEGVNRNGDVITNVIVEKVTLTKKQDRTVVLQVLVPIEFLYEFVTIRRPL